MRRISKSILSAALIPLAAVFLFAAGAPPSASGGDLTAAPTAGLPASPRLTSPLPAPKKVIIIPVEQEVDYGLYAFLKRAVAEALKQHPDALVFKVNTYGGELQSAFDIVDLLAGISQCSTYAYVEQKAISAGALISLSCNRIVMGQGTTLGDCAPITQGGEGGIVMLGEKIQSPLRAKFRTLAERNGYPSLLAQAMVTADMGVVAAAHDSAHASTGATYFTVKQWDALAEADKKKYGWHKTIVAEGQLLTMTDREAVQYGFSQGSFTGLDAFLSSKGWEKAGELQTTWSESLVRVIGKFAPILMLLGFGALYLEFKTPGLSVFGFLGIACLAVAFGSKYAVGLANYTELLLLVGGMILFLVEIYLFPGTLIFGGIGIALMVVALALSLQSYTLPDPKLPWEMRASIRNLTVTLSMAVLALLIPVLGFKFLAPYLPKSARVISEATLKGARNVTMEAEALAVGFVGTAKTALRPTGKILIDGKVYEAASRGGFIDAGRAVEVVKISGNSISVREKEA